MKRTPAPRGGLLSGPAPPGPSVSGLVEEDIARLRVLGDLRGESVELLYGLGVDFLEGTDRMRGGGVRKINMH